MTVPSLVLSATTDPELHARDVHLLLHLLTHLDVVQYERVKQAWLAKRLGISQPEVCRAMRRLRLRGYIERDPQMGADGGCGRYRVRLSPFPSQDEAA